MGFKTKRTHPIDFQIRMQHPSETVIITYFLCIDFLNGATMKATAYCDVIEDAPYWNLHHDPSGAKVFDQLLSIVW